MKKKVIIILLILLTLTGIQTACADSNIAEMENITSINEEDTLNEIESDNESDEKLSEEKIDIKIEPIKVKTSYQTGNCTFKITNSNTGDLIKNKSIKFTVQITGMINIHHHKQLKLMKMELQHSY